MEIYPLDWPSKGAAGSPLVEGGMNKSWALRSPIAFGIAMVLLMFALELLASPLIKVLGGGSTNAPLRQGNILLVLLVLLTLPIETFLGQAMPIWLMKKCGVINWPLLCLLSALFFGLLHAPIGGGAFVVGFTAGLVLSWCWLSWRPRSVSMAFWSTTGVHVAYDAVAALLLLAATNTGSPPGKTVMYGCPPFPSFPEGTVTSSLSIDVDYSKGEINVDAYNVEFGKLVESVFKTLSEVDKAAPPSVAGDAAVLKKEVSGRCMGHNRAELIDQLQAIGCCAIEINNSGTSAVITDSRRPDEPSRLPNSRPGKS